MTRIAFTADLHCDDYGSRIDPATGLNARWIDTVAMARWIAEDATKRHCDALIVGGDLTEQRHPAPWRVAQIGEAIGAFGGEVILARGNHDGMRGGKSIVDVLAADREFWTGYSTPGFEFQAGHKTAIETTGVCVLPFLDRHLLRVVPGFEALSESELSQALGDAYLTIARGLYAKAASPHRSTVLVVHQALAGGLMSDTQAAFLGDQGLVVDTRALGAIGFEAVLAGHFHKHQVLSTEPLVVYAGSPYRTDFGEEHQPKGYLVVDVQPGRASFEFVETPARPFVTLAGADIEAGVTAGQVEGAVVRVRDLDPMWDVAALRRELEAAGAFEVQSIAVRRVDAPAATGGMAEGLTAPEALTEYFAGDEDAEAIVPRGLEILQEVLA